MEASTILNQELYATLFPEKLSSSIGRLRDQEVHQVGARKKQASADPLVTAFIQIVTALVVGNKKVKGAVNAWENRELKAFDCNPGDGQCQLRGYLIGLLSSKAEIGTELRDLKRQVQAWDPNGRSAGLLTAVKVSNEVLYLLRCYFSASLLNHRKIPSTANSSYITRLACTKRAQAVGSDMLAAVQRDISKDSVDMLAKEAEKLTVVNKELVMQMLAPLSTTDKYQNQGERSVGCMFYQYVAILDLLKALCKPVCFADSGQRSCLFLKSPTPGKEFIKDGTLTPQDSVVVFLGEVSPSFIGQLENAFTEVILVCGAIERQYSTARKEPEDFRQEARDQINSYRRQAREWGCDKESLNPTVKLYHVYASTVEAELRMWSTYED